jgi:hypothetical protein
MTAFSNPFQYCGIDWLAMALTFSAIYCLGNKWLVDYLPKIKEIDEPLFPSIGDLTGLRGQVRVIPIPTPHDCTDGFLCAYWRRPQAYLDKDVRRAISTFSRVTEVADGLQTLAKDLNSGVWYQ